MTKPYDRFQPRRPQASEPIGYLATLQDKLSRAKGVVDGLRMRLNTRIPTGYPSCIAVTKTWQPETGVFTFNEYQAQAPYKGDASVNVSAQYIVRDGVTYSIPLVNSPPGIFDVEYIVCTMQQRLVINSGNNQWITQQGVGQGALDWFGGQFQANLSSAAAVVASNNLQTRKVCYPYQEPDTTGFVAPRMAFFWNLVEEKSGRNLSDENLPDVVMLNNASPIGADTSANGGRFNGLFRFDTPWRMERDSTMSFKWRPIMPVIQPAATESVLPYVFNDREGGTARTAARNWAFTVRVELHGTRYYNEQDLLMQGAASRDALEQASSRMGR